MSLAIIPLAITMNAGPQIMSAIIFITAPKPLKLRMLELLTAGLQERRLSTEALIVF